MHERIGNNRLTAAISHNPHCRCGVWGARLCPGPGARAAPEGDAGSVPDRAGGPDVFIWAGGIQASPVLQASVKGRRPPVPRLDARGRAQVAPDLRVCFEPPGAGEEIPFYAVGDAVVFEDPATHRPLTATAHMAIAEALGRLPPLAPGAAHPHP